MDESVSEDLDAIHAADKRILEQVMSTTAEEADKPELVYQTKGLIQSFGLLLYEQKAHWPLYAALLIGALGAACKNTFHL